MNEMIEKIKNRYKIPNDYAAYEIDSAVWTKKFKDKSNIEVCNVSIDTEIKVTKKFGYFNGKYFVVVAFFDMKSDMYYYYIFTNNFAKFKDEYLKDLIGKIKPFKITTGVWKPVSTMMGWSFEKVDVGETVSPILNNNLFTDINNEIKAFIDKEDKYKKNNLEYKRGILMYGSPGNGKTSFIKSLIKNLNAIVIIPDTKQCGVIDFLAEFLSRSQYDDMLKIVIFEDIDGINGSSRSEFLNLLDGVNRLYKTMFIATTNFPEKLDIGIRNRPSRFDRFVEIKIPNDKSRELLIKQHFKNVKKSELEYGIKNTKGFSGAYFKELYVLSILLELNLRDAIIEMKKRFKMFGD